VKTYNFNGKITGAAASHYSLKLIVTVGDSNLTTLQTPITIKLTRTSDSYGGNYGYNNPTTVKINGTTMATATPKSNHDDVTTQTLIENSGIIYHDADGKVSHVTIGSNTVSNITNNTFTVSASFTSSSPNLSGGSVSGSVSVESIDVTPNTISSITTFILGLSNPTITIKKANANFTTSLYYRNLNNDLVLIVSKTTATSYTWNLSTSYINELKKAYSTGGTVTVVAYTYSGDTELTKTSTLTQSFTVPKPNNITNISSFVLGESNPTITISKTDSNFTTTLEYEVEGDLGTYTGTMVQKTTATSYKWEIDSVLVSELDSLFEFSNQGTLTVTAKTYSGNTLIEGTSSYSRTFTISKERPNEILNVTDFILGQTNPTVTLKKGDSSFTTSLYVENWVYNEAEGYYEQDYALVASKISGTTYNWVLNETAKEILLQSSYGKKAEGRLYAEFYNGSDIIATSYFTFSFTVSDIYKPVVTNVTLTELNEKVANLTDKIVRYQSRLNAVISATAGKNRTIETYLIKYGNKEGNDIGSSKNSLILENEITVYMDEDNYITYTDLLDSYTTLPDGHTTVAEYTAKVRDERSYYSDDYIKTTGFVPYINLTLDNYSIARLSSTSDSVKLTAKGSFFDSDELGKQNELVVFYKYREKGTTTWLRGTTSITRNNGVTYSNEKYNLDIVLKEQLDYKKSWEFEVYLNDLLLNLQIAYTLETDLVSFANNYINGIGNGYGLIIENEEDNHMILTNDDDFAIEYLDGFYSLGATLSTVKIGTRDGEKLSARSVNKRNIGIYLYIKKNVSENRLSLYKIFKAKQKVKISYYSKKRQVSIEGYVEDLTITPHQQLTQAQIIIVCPYPFLRNIEDIIVDLSQTKGNFYFPFYVTDNKKALGYNLETTAREIPNNGDYPTGMYITMKATSKTTNPFIFDSNNNFFQLGTATKPFVMESGDELRIDTENKKVTLLSNTVETNVFNYIAPNSKWLQLQVGNNTIDYNNSAKVKMEVIITYNNKYEGV